jgi:ATP-dependent RNA circularization protein (DNA/RNA ligase family)
MNDFYRFPHTPHLAWLGKDTPRDDKVLTVTEAEQFLSHPIVIEEKIDGANLGFSLDRGGEVRAQNRGQYLQRPFTGQFARLNEWLAIHEEALFEALGESLMLFGEWVAAVHSLEYNRMPDYLLVFDVYDRDEKRFWSTAHRNALAAGLELCPVQRLGIGQYPINTLRQMLATTQSHYRNGGCEGFYLRHEDDNWLISRAKLVQPDFVQNIGEHWRSRSLRWNTLATLPQPHERFARLT